MKEKFEYLFYLMILLASFPLTSQNLVPNPSFEERRGKSFTFKPWEKINTIDFYANAPDYKAKNVNPRKEYKTYILRNARTGYAYAGFRVWPKYHEFLVVKLKKPLEAGKAYSFEMYVTPSRYANCYLKTIGASFYPSKINYSKCEAMENFPPQIQLFMPYGIRPQDTSEWIRINGVFLAQGGEKYLTIGCFTPQKRKKLKRKNFSLKKRDAYYYIDDIALYELNEQGIPIKDSTYFISTIAKENVAQSSAHEEETQTTTVETMPVDSMEYVDYIKDKLPEDLKNIYFDYNSSRLNLESHKNLATVVEFLLENPSYKLEIRGYASPGENKGNELLLARKRAKAVAIFLNGNKIPNDRLFVNPIGVQCPYEIIQKKKEKECQRVELVLIK